MKTTLNEFLNGEIGQITKSFLDKGCTMQQVIEELNPIEDSYEIELMGMYHCPSGRELQDFIHHSRWGQKIKRHVKFLNSYRSKIEMELKKIKKEEK